MSLNVKVEKKGHFLVYVTSYYPHKVFLKYEKKRENVRKMRAPRCWGKKNVQDTLL